MSGQRDSKKQPDPYKAERQEAAQQNGTLDAVMNVPKVINPWGLNSGFHFGKTSFEGYDLNEMIDIVESSNPELVESAGTALVAARDAITKAAEELSLNLGDVDWKGEAHTAFTTWGNDLVTTAYGLADYADVVGTQVLAASSGLASVRKSMPPRDARTDPKKVDDIPEAKRVDSNDEYTAAVKAEGHRQEAINQMYRLASFYTVSSGMMATAEEPVFPKMPDAGVPAPLPGRDPFEGQSPRETLQPPSDKGVTRPHPVHTPVSQAHVEGLSSHKAVDDSVRSPEHPVGTVIDSVGTLPPQEITKPGPVTSPSTAGPSSPTVGTTAPLSPIAASTAVRGAVGRASGIGGMPANRTPATAQGRAGSVPKATPAARAGTGPTGPVGRVATPGQAVGRTTGPLGRGVVGGMPRAIGQVAGGQASGTPRGPVTGVGAVNSGRTAVGRAGVGRTTDGVVGGRPVAGTAPGANNSKVPRGTVVGGEGTPTSRTTGEKPGQRGVIGASASTTSAGQASRRPSGGPDGVVGTPKGRVAGATNRSGQMPGGTSGTRRPTRDQGSGDGRSRRENRRERPSSSD
ncbi:hypothetical protein [Streptomyces sp. NPDC002132]|uniref:hypothetical protein n=1 Tax=unclassified Streptomyces TaxID=2593676 RepID=UPI00331B06CC